MFGLVDRQNYDIRIFFVNNNRTRETLLPIVVKNVYTYLDSINSNEDADNEYPATRIYSDCFMSYSPNEFNSEGYILYRVNHSYWFGSGSFHTNTIEGVWSQIKRITSDFYGMNGSIFKSYANDYHIIETYFNALICTALFFMRCEHLKLGDQAKILLLKYHLKFE